MYRGFLGIVIIVVLLSGAVGIWHIQNSKSPDSTLAPTISFAERPAKSQLDILAVAGDEAIYHCRDGTCELLPKPERLEDATAVGIAEWVGFTTESRAGLQPSVRVLQRALKDGESQNILEQTPLTRPRDILVSPDGGRFVFFLDNTSDPAAQLTELWLYDQTSGGVKVLAEKLFRPDIRSTIRWNSSSNYLWFLADTGERSSAADQLQLEVVSLLPPYTRIVFTQVDWSKLADDFSKVSMDISPAGEKIAYVTKNIWRQSVVAVQGQKSTDKITVHGEVPYVQWLDEDSLVYASEDASGFSWWIDKGGTQRLLARQAGSFISARGEARTEYVSFIVRQEGEVKLRSLHLASGSILNEGQLPDTGGQLLLVKSSSPAVPLAQVAGTVAALEDDELIAFLNRNIDAISGYAGRLERVLITDQINTAYVDVRPAEGESERLLVTVLDAAQTDWRVIGKYRRVGSEWVRSQGVDTDPKGIRLYEWEAEVSQWIRK